MELVLYIRLKVAFLVNRPDLNLTDQSPQASDYSTFNCDDVRLFSGIVYFAFETHRTANLLGSNSVHFYLAGAITPGAGDCDIAILHFGTSYF